MKQGLAKCAVFVFAVLASCKQPNDVTVNETRELTTKDKPMKLSATSDERFRDAKPSPVQGDLPKGWREVPPSQFRILNYRFGASGHGQAWVSIASGSILENANRWLGQFGAEKMDSAGLAKLKRVPMLGAEGVWVTAQGTYNGGMGQEPASGYGLAGVITSVGNQIVTVKMVGPAEEVKAESATLEAFAKSLRMSETH